MSIFIFVIFTSFPSFFLSFFLSFFFFCPSSLVAFRSGGGEGDGQNLGPRVEKRGGECKGGEKKKREQWFLMCGKREKELKKSGGNRG